jgi:hypothetical protein
MRTGRSRYGDGQVLSVPAVRKDGARISVEFIIVPFTNDSGQMIGIAAIMRDASRHRRIKRRDQGRAVGDESASRNRKFESTPLQR